MGKLLAVCAVLFGGLIAWIYFLGAPETEGHAVDAHKAADSAGKAADVVTTTAAPWYQLFIDQPWAGTAIGGLVCALILKSMWKGMNGTARIGTAVIGTVLFMLTAVGLAAK